MTTPKASSASSDVYKLQAVDGGLKPHSDIDLLVTVTVRLDETTRRALINDLLETALLQIVGGDKLIIPFC
ncbi:hypothetical protein BS589_26080 [Klebsiella pneumoniae]|nr:hypothetical protein BS589_26080 [Klebsiella pneumoniae]